MIEATFTTSECEPGQTWTMAEMLAANYEDTYLCEWLRSAKVGERWRGIVTVTRVS